MRWRWQSRGSNNSDNGGDSAEPMNEVGTSKNGEERSS